jgi:hypothetical protein
MVTGFQFLIIEIKIRRPRMATINAKEIQPVAVEINTEINPNWNYWDSVKTVRRLFLKWELVSEQILNELWIAKKAITKNGRRSSGLPKKGEISWTKYLNEAFQGMVSKRTIDAHLKAYVENGFKKPEKLTVATVSDHSKVIVKSAVHVGDRIQLEIYLPEFDKTYYQSVAA